MIINSQHSDILALSSKQQCMQTSTRRRWRRQWILRFGSVVKYEQCTFCFCANYLIFRTRFQLPQRYSHICRIITYVNNSGLDKAHNLPLPSRCLHRYQSLLFRSRNIRVWTSCPGLIRSIDRPGITVSRITTQRAHCMDMHLLTCEC